MWIVIFKLIVGKEGMNGVDVGGEGWIKLMWWFFFLKFFCWFLYVLCVGVKY